MKLYSELAPWWPLLVSLEDFAEEAEVYIRALRAVADGEARSVLELGSGAGNIAAYLSAEFDLTLVDISADMLAVSEEINSDCAHVEGDMRTVRLDRTFDAVFIHDAIIYMTTEEDLRAVLATAAAHCRAGGALVIMPDHTAETFVATTGHGGMDEETGRGARYLQWAFDPDPDDTTYQTCFSVMLRHEDGRVETHNEQHTCGVFPRATWLRLLAEAGFEGRIEPFVHSELEEGVCEMVVGKVVGKYEQPNSRTTKCAHSH